MKRMKNGQKTIIAGAVIAIVSILIYEIPGVVVSVSLASAHNICNSSLGAFGELMSSQVRNSCQHVSLYFTADLLFGITGLLIVAFGIYELLRKDAGTQLQAPQREGDCYRCGRPASEHEAGARCPSPVQGAAL